MQTDGLNFLKTINGPVAPVVVIGPYRSGKSFLLNQLLQVPCDEGFGVGHERSTKTKGVWVWSKPKEVQSVEGVNLSVLFIDTEGFESTGKSDSYDDRIFALSTLMSSVLIYNLPETIRESDLEKLSFAVELSSGLYNPNMKANDRLPVEPGNMLWLIQRDFLQGKSVDEMLWDALQPVTNPKGDKDIDQLNRIRSSLSAIAKNSTAFGLKQPHLERTKLCSLEDKELDPTYVKQRSDLRDLVDISVVPKMFMGRVMMGGDMAELIAKIVQALNERDIPSVGSILDHFNLDLVHKALSRYSQHLSTTKLPVDEKVLLQFHLEELQASLLYYDEHRFGRSEEMVKGARKLREELSDAIEKEYQTLQMNNTIQSGEVCEKLESACERKLEGLQVMNIPSKNRFEGEYQQCLHGFEAHCVGPALLKEKSRLELAWQREHKRFILDYNDHLYTGLVILSLVDIVVFRFLFKVQLAEGTGWFLFLFLEAYPKVIGTSESMYSSTWWQVIVRIWEFLAYNPITKSWLWMIVLSIILIFLWRNLRKRRRRRSKLPSRNFERDLDV